MRGSTADQGTDWVQGFRQPEGSSWAGVGAGAACLVSCRFCHSLPSPLCHLSSYKDAHAARPGDLPVNPDNNNVETHTPKPPIMQEAIAAEAWRAALSRAAGEKVLDDPKLLRKSIKRAEADKARSSKKWQERVATQQEQQRARQEKCVGVVGGFGGWG